MEKLTRSRVLQGRTEFCRALMGGDGARKFSPSCERSAIGVRQNHAGWERRSYPSNPPRPIAILRPLVPIKDSPATKD